MVKFVPRRGGGVEYFARLQARNILKPSEGVRRNRRPATSNPHYAKCASVGERGT